MSGNDIKDTQNLINNDNIEVMKEVNIDKNAHEQDVTNSQETIEQDKDTVTGVRDDNRRILLWSIAGMFLIYLAYTGFTDYYNSYGQGMSWLVVAIFVLFAVFGVFLVIRSIIADRKLRKRKKIDKR
ncbi:MAG: MFS transporter [Clostridiales bacterium]|nr:MFS transporter [Clostridiales bacterium]